MAKLTDIKYRIDQMDGGTFQTLCDVYLRCRGYGSGYSLGTKTGTSKTTTGNPDTYFLTTNNKYVFAMYTTQKTDFVNKAIEDLEKCFDVSKTGVSPNDVVEIVYCHTCGRLLAGADKKLRDFCNTKNVKLTLVGLNELSEDLYLKYPRLARDYLGISIDTGQITTPEEFVQNHDGNEMSAPLNTQFLFREDVAKEAKISLETNNILIISGPAGTGKTRLALQICEELSVTGKYDVLCIKSNGLELHEDLVTAIEDGKEYLLLVDDANELSGLQHVLQYISRVSTRPQAIKKIILTVRDYARKQVITQVLEVEKPKILKIGPLKDEDIRKLVQETFRISNPQYLDRIVVIAEGNPRLAMLAGKIAVKTEQLESIRDASELYEYFYSKQIETVSKSRTGTISMGIMSFFQILHLDYLDQLDSIFCEARITKEQFVSDLKQFHDMELLDLCHNKAAKVSDQSFSNYLIKYVFIDQKAIPLSKMIETCFPINQGRTISACNILFNVFSDPHIHEYIEQQIALVWDSIQCNPEKFLPFFKSFLMIRPTDTLILLKDAIEQELFRPFDVHSIEFKKNKGEKNISDDIISILCSFKNHSLLPEAVELLLLYYRKRPDLFEQIYSAFVSSFGVDKRIYNYGYFTPKTAMEKLCAEVQRNPSDATQILFVRVSEQFLKLSVSRTEGGRQNTITFYTMPLVFHEDVVVYRNMLLHQLLEIYKAGHCHEEIESLFIDYCSEREENLDYEIIRSEFGYVLQFLSLLSTDSLYHCIIANHIKDVAQRIEYDCQDSFSQFIDSSKYKIYRVLCNCYDDIVHTSLEEKHKQLNQRIKVVVQTYDLSQFQYLLQVCTECILTVDQDERQLSYGMRLVMKTLAGNKESFADIVKAYIDADTPYSVRPDDILQNLFAIMSPEEVKNLISTCDFTEKNSWLWAFYAELPENHISMKWTKELLSYLQSPPKGLKAASYRTLDLIKKYECADKKIFLKASRIISEHYEDSPFVFSLYFFEMMNSYSINKAEVVAQYRDDIQLLEDIYLKDIMYSSNTDSDGELLSEIVKKDPGFFKCYLEKAASQTQHFYESSDPWFGRLLFIWQDDDFLNYMDRIANHLLSLESAGNFRFFYSYGINRLLIHREGEEKEYHCQEEWIQCEIGRSYLDAQRMYGLFRGISEHGTDRRRNALKRLLELNGDYALFETLPLEANSWGGWGSMVPYMQERINYLTSLLPMLSGLKFLKHKQRVEKEIEMWKAKIREEEIREIMESFS